MPSVPDPPPRVESAPPPYDGRPPEGTRAPRRRRVGAPVLALGLVLIAVLAGLAWLQARPPVAGGTGTLDLGGAFRMVDQNGRAVDQSLLRGKWSAVFFGYTFCPDTCPATLQMLAAASDRLGDKARDFQVVFVTVDPARDTPAQMKLYLSAQAFPKRAWGLTGTPEQVAAIAKAYRVYYARSGAGPNYLMDHSAAIYLMNPQGRFDRVLNEGMQPDIVAGQIREAMSGKSG